MQVKAAFVILAAGCLFAGCDQPVPSAEEAAAEQPPVVAQQALAGVGKEGQSLKDQTGIGKMIAGPAMALFSVRQRAVLEFQIPPAVNLFKASEGRYPKSHEEFMTKIVQANRLVLPELPAGSVYHFNSELGQLWVYPAGEVPQ